MSDFDDVVAGLDGEDLLDDGVTAVVSQEWWRVERAVERHGWPKVEAALDRLDDRPPW